MTTKIDSLISEMDRIDEGLSQLPPLSVRIDKSDERSIKRRELLAERLRVQRGLMAEEGGFEAFWAERERRDAATFDVATKQQLDAVVEQFADPSLAGASDAELRKHMGEQS